MFLNVGEHEEELCKIRYDDQNTNEKEKFLQMDKNKKESLSLKPTFLKHMYSTTLIICEFLWKFI